MIKFFRHIRQRLLSENKFNKYLLYAVGEIILVVIGILIALQINNWNEERKERNEEQMLLTNLKQEFQKNLLELQRDHSINLKMLNTTHYFLENEMSSKSSMLVDSIVGGMCTFATFDPSIGYFQQAINSNSLDLIQSDSLKIILSQWSGELNDLNEDNIIRREHWLNHLLPAIRKHIPVRNSDQAQYRPDYIRTLAISPMEVPSKNYVLFSNSLEIDGVIYDHYMNQSYVVINEENVKQFILKVLKLIDKELKNSEG